jgi:2-oxoglutarate ferredoxin oxidoreductase subunit gamma
MNQPSLARFQNQIQSGGQFFINSSLVKPEIIRGDVEIVSVAANNIAEELGNQRTANMVMLGAFIKKSKVVSLDNLLEGLKSTLGNKPKVLAANEIALQKGYELF